MFATCLRTVFFLTGYALETEFIISCYDWVNPGEEASKGAGLLYRFWSKLRGRQDTQLLYYGTDPYTPDTTFPLGPEESDFLHDVVVRIANPIGEYVETWLSVRVSKPVVKNDVSELITLTSGEDSTLTGLLSSGKTQEAKQVIVAVASLINTSPTEVFDLFSVCFSCITCVDLFKSHLVINYEHSLLKKIFFMQSIILKILF